MAMSPIYCLFVRLARCISKDKQHCIVLTKHEYTPTGRIKKIRTSNGITTSYEYDSDGNISRLTIGNGTEEGLFYDAFMLYDLNGNRLGKTGQRMGVEGKQEMNTVFCYHAMNRLTMENRREGEEGLRVRLEENGNNTTFLFYNGEILAECNEDSMPVRRFLAGPWKDETL